MRKINSLFLLLVLSVVSFCGNEKKNEINGKTNAEGVNICYSDSIRFIIKNIEFKSDAIYLDKLFFYFQKCDLDKECSFPAIKGDDKLIYKALGVLKEKAKSDYNSLEFLVKLSFIIKRNVELSEYLAKLTPQLALQNTKAILTLYYTLDEESKDFFLDNLEYFNGQVEYKLFMKNLNEIQDKALRIKAKKFKEEFEKKLFK